ncbi:hypothetical protein AX17_001183 [Amanita inopinata Kibby_2008]|nr:hypothetical protein AX17_001183 [Amanita inopinata Kibby_2008]
MSRHPSPGPSAQPSHQPPSVSTRQKQQKAYSIGIAAGAEDVKYQTKYKELKRKVKDIEADNDKLHFKVLQAKRSIQRMKLERAILYQRLSSPTPPPETHDRHAPQQLHHPVSAVPPYQPPIRGHSGNIQHRELRDHPPTGDDHTLVDYLRTQGNSRVGPAAEARHLPSMDYPIGPGVTSSPHMLHSPRRNSNNHDIARQLPPLQQLQSIPLDVPRSHSHPQPAPSPPTHHSHATPSNERTRSHSSSHSRGHQPHPQSYMTGSNQQQYPDSRTPTQHAMHSPALSERERSRRHDVHEMNEPHNLARPQLSPSPHSADVRSSSRIHNHQRMGPGTYINRDDQHDRQQDVDRDREWERSREINRGRDYNTSHMLSPQLLQRSHSALERGEHAEHHLSSRIREDSNYYHEVLPSAGYSMLSRPGSPGSGSVSGDGQRADSLVQRYETERSRSYRLRPVNQPNEAVEYMQAEDGRPQARDQGGGGGNFLPPPQEPSHTSMEGTRKRSRNDMDIDSEPEMAENAGGNGVTNSGYIGARVSEDRSSKRYHLPRSVDNHEDSRMGPP